MYIQPLKIRIFTDFVYRPPVQIYVPLAKSNTIRDTIPANACFTYTGIQHDEKKYSTEDVVDHGHHAISSSLPCRVGQLTGQLKHQGSGGVHHCCTGNDGRTEESWNTEDWSNTTAEPYRTEDSWNTEDWSNTTAEPYRTEDSWNTEDWSNTTAEPYRTEDSWNTEDWSNTTAEPYRTEDSWNTEDWGNTTAEPYRTEDSWNTEDWSNTTAEPYRTEDSWTIHNWGQTSSQANWRGVEVYTIVVLLMMDTLNTADMQKTEVIVDTISQLKHRERMIAGTCWIDKTLKQAELYRSDHRKLWKQLSHVNIIRQTEDSWTIQISWLLYHTRQKTAEPYRSHDPCTIQDWRQLNHTDLMIPVLYKTEDSWTIQISWSLYHTRLKTAEPYRSHDPCTIQDSRQLNHTDLMIAVLYKTEDSWTIQISWSLYRTRLKTAEPYRYHDPCTIQDWRQLSHADLMIPVPYKTENSWTFWNSW